MSFEVVAVAARTPVGLTAESSAAAVRARISRIREFPFIHRNGEPIRACADSRIDPWISARERLPVLARSVIDELARKLGQPYPGRCRVWLALPEPRPGFDRGDAERVARALAAPLAAAFPRAQVDTLASGHAAAALAIEHVLTQPAAVEELHVIVGVDSVHDPATLAWLERERLLAGPGVRSGFFPGEGAGGLVLAAPHLRQQLQRGSFIPGSGLRLLATLAGVGTARETELRNSESGTFGVGMTEAALRALAGSRFPEHAIDGVYIDINGERYRSEEWGFVAMRASYAFRTLDYVAATDAWGDVGAASVPLLVVLAIQAWARGYAAGPRALVLAGSFGGLRGAVALTDPHIHTQGKI